MLGMLVALAYIACFDPLHGEMAVRATKTPIKRSLQTMGLLTCLLILSACGKESAPSASMANAPPAAPQAAPAPVASVKRAIDRIISSDAIGMDLASVAKIAGPAVRSEAHRHLYRVDGCEVTLRSDDADKRVQAVEVALAPECQASLEPVIGGYAGTPAMQLSELSFGNFEIMLGGRYYADCLASCGNAADPVVSLYVQGPQTLKGMGFVLQAPLVNGPALEASLQWKQAMEKAESEHYVVDNRFNCEPERFRDSAVAAFAFVKPVNFVFGRGLDYPKDACDL